MSLPIPNVPNLPGVPQLPGYLPTGATTLTLETVTGTRNLGNIGAFTNPANLEALAIQQITSVFWHASQAPVEWGIFDSDGDQVVYPDSVIDFDNRNEWQVSSFPVQAAAGQASGFQSFNKVVVPYETMVTMRKAGNGATALTDRANFLTSLDLIAGDTNIYTILTPECSYQGNITRYEVARRGAPFSNLIEVDVYFIAINQVAAVYSNSTISDTSNAKDPNALPTLNIGTVQPSAPTQPVNAAAAALGIQ